MKASKTLGRPDNWEDFESLCKKLWGEIWSCPEIKKNGRKGQNQNGVDIYGMPSFEEEYYGIQCKGKDEYTHKQLTKKEIETEIEKAKTFLPKLKKLYFATTAVKDAEIEKLIRIKNIENKKHNFFEVHIFSWEDIVDLIHENRETYAYYVDSINFKTSNSVQISFSDNSKELIIIPKFRKRVTQYKQKNVSQDLMIRNPFLDIIQKQEKIVSIVNPLINNKTVFNLSYSQFRIKIHNTGNLPIENHKLQIKFEGDITNLSHTNKKVTGNLILPTTSKKISNTVLYEKSMEGEIVPLKSILVGDDSFLSDDIFIKPFPKASKIVIKWKLISKNFKQTGELLLVVKPNIKTIWKDVFVDDYTKVRVEEGELEDYIIEDNTEQ